MPMMFLGKNIHWQDGLMNEELLTKGFEKWHTGGDDEEGTGSGNVGDACGSAVRAGEGWGE